MGFVIFFWKTFHLNAPKIFLLAPMAQIQSISINESEKQRIVLGEGGWGHSGGATSRKYDVKVCGEWRWHTNKPKQV